LTYLPPWRFLILSFYIALASSVGIAPIHRCTPSVIIIVTNSQKLLKKSKIQYYCLAHPIIGHQKKELRGFFGIYQVLRTTLTHRYY